MAATTDPVVKVGPVIWIARLRTGRVVIFRASDSRVFKAGAATALAAEADSVVIVSVVAAVIASAVDHSAAVAALADLAVAAGGADGNN